MAPLTRCRAEGDHVPTAIMAQYYAQRASAGLIIAEATMILPGNSAFISEPGIYSAEQVQAWKRVTDRVHQAGGRIFLQLWHGGRACHPAMNQGRETVAPSAIRIEGEVHTPVGKAPHVTPRALKLEEIPQIIEGFRLAAVNAGVAGFDGVEVHAANGYLIDEFLRDGSNQRTDVYGGSVENRMRLLLETVDRVSSVFGAGRVGVRISPLNSYNSMRDSDPLGLTRAVARELSKKKIAYLHVMRGDFAGIQKGAVLESAREAFEGVLLGNMGFTADDAREALARGALDAVAFGSMYISNPDLVDRIRLGRSLTSPDPSTFYTPGPRGYTDYAPSA